MALALVAAGGWYAWRAVFQDSGSPGAPVTVTIPQGASFGRIADVLDAAGVVRSGLVFSLRARVNGDGSRFRAGVYRLRRNERYARIVAALDAGPPPPPVARLVVPEGYAIRDTARIVPRVGISSGAYATAARTLQPPPGWRPTGGERITGEGFLFPATYDVARRTSASTLVRRQVQAFARATAGVDFRAAARKRLTRYDVLIIASLVEREAAYGPDRARIAAVIYNRLHLGMPLQIDASVQYALGAWRAPTLADLHVASPFNTYLHAGLPPAPICNPGLASIEAAAHPVHAGYLYYVAIPGDPRRRSHFTTTYAEFQRYRAAHPG